MIIVYGLELGETTFTVTSSDHHDTHTGKLSAYTYDSFKPAGKGPWSLKVRGTVALEQIDHPEALVLYAGQGKGFVCKREGD